MRARDMTLETAKSTPEFDARLAQAAEQTEAYLAKVLSAQQTVPSRLLEAMRHATLGGGKRLRPFLVQETARLFGVTGDGPLAAAAALECIHCYSLVHDDLPAMDNDELRRGRPTVWKAYDEWTAILAGDGLLTLAFELVSAPDVPLAAPVKLELVHGLARASGMAGMVGGQVIDLTADKLEEPKQADEAHVRQLQSMKTGALILYAAEAGAIIGDATWEERQSLVSFGRAIGLAFQIADDLLDVEGDAASVGKAVGKDAEAGKATFVGLLGVEAAREELRATHAKAIAYLEPFGAQADVLRRTADFIVERKH